MRTKDIARKYGIDQNTFEYWLRESKAPFASQGMRGWSVDDTQNIDAIVQHFRGWHMDTQAQLAQQQAAEEKAAQERRGAAGAAQRGGPPHLRMGAPSEKSRHFGPSAKRLLAIIGRDRLALYAALAATVLSVTFTAIGPRILGRATDYVFAGFAGRELPAGVSVHETIAALRAAGQDRKADLLAGMGALVVPGRPGEPALVGARADHRRGRQPRRLSASPRCRGQAEPPAAGLF